LIRRFDIAAIVFGPHRFASALNDGIPGIEGNLGKTPET